MPCAFVPAVKGGKETQGHVTDEERGRGTETKEENHLKMMVRSGVGGEIQNK